MASPGPAVRSRLHRAPDDEHHMIAHRDRLSFEPGELGVETAIAVSSLRRWGNIEHMFATFRGAVNIGHIATFRGQIPNMLGQHLGVRPMVPRPETLEETL